MIHKTTRSILSVLLAALLLVTSVPLTPAFADGGAVSLQSESAESEGLTGSGTKDNPYQIGSAAELRKFAELVNDGETDADAVLTADIDLSEICGENIGGQSVSWTPIGNSINNPYEGNFNGDGHTISGLYINNSTADYQGLFGYVGSSGKIEKLSVSGDISGRDHVGGVVGYNGGTVENCHNIGEVSGNRYVGGVVGYNGTGATVSNCYNTGTITGTDDYVVGVVGYNNGGTVENCHNIGEVSGNRYVVGVVGSNNNGTVENCYNTGSVTGTDDYVGGVVGYNYGSVTNCYNTGSVSGLDSGSGNSVGGVVGYNISLVKNCYNTGSVSGPDNGNSNQVGGVVGRNDSGTVKNCYNTGSVSGPDSGSDSNVGGVVGLNSASVTNCYNTGKVSGPDSGSGSYVGGVVGDNRGSVTGCYFLKTDDVNSNLQGIGNDRAEGAESLTAEEFKNQNSFTHWDFGSTDTPGIWEINTTLNRPVLKDNHEDDGSEQHPYEIFTATQLENFRDLVNDENGNPAAWAVLMENITLNSNEEWEPIGNSESTAYTGTFNGQNFKISGLYIKNTSSVANYQGLFGYVGSGGIVQNLSVSGSVSGHFYVGGVVGYNNGGTVTGCTFSGSGSVSGDWYVGGVVGRNDGTVKNCYNTVTVSGSDHVGGVVGDNRGSVENCYNTVSVSGNRYVGGVVGDNRGSVTNCYNTDTGTVTGADNYVGGVVGDNNSTVKNCYNTGAVTGNRYVGGVVGDNSGSVTNCYNTDSGTVTGTDDYVGGVVGQNFGGTVENCYNTVNVTGTGNWVGGVVGWNSGPVKNCYNTGTVSDGTTSGGVVGQNFGSGSVTNCYYQTGKGAAVGVGGTTGDNSSQTAAKSLEDFRSGEVAYLLQGTQITPVWGQSDLTTLDSWPTLIALDNSAQTVYKVITDYGYVEQPNDVSYTNNPAEPAAPSRDGYTFGGWDKTGEGTTTITYTAKWTAEEPPYTGKYSYEVFTSVGDNGTVTVDRYATEGDTVTIQVAPDQAYKLDELVVTANGKDVELTANSDGTYSFTMPSADVRITATFAEDPDWTPDEPEEPATDVSDLFSDIAPDAWYKDAIQYAYDNGLMTGVSATEFAPEATTTRAMIVSILARLEGVESAEAAGFADVNDNDWYATAVNWAANVGVVNGYEDNTFQPNTAITREQLAAILMNYAAYKGEDVSNRADLTSYTDQPSTWAEEAMSWAVAEGLISGVTNDQLQPQGNATRAQVAAILQRYLEA